MLHTEVEPQRTFARRAPILGLALTALAGTYTGLVCPVLWPGIAVVCLCAIACLVPTVRKRLPANLVVFIFVAAAFFVRAWIDERPPSGEHLVNQAQGDESVVMLVRITAEPVLYPRADGSSTNTFVPAEAKAIQLTTQPTSAHGAVQLAFFDQIPNIAYGDELRIEGTLERRDGPGPLLSRTRHRVRVHSFEVVDTHQGNALLAASYRLRQGAARILGVGLDQSIEVRGVLRAMILGYRQELPRDWSQRFARTGTLHVFAISGLHVGILAAVVLFVLKWFGVSRTRIIFVLLPLIVMFVVCTGLKASAIRATIMLGLYWLAPAIRRPTDSRAALALAVLVILVWAPHQIRSIGFLFSFIIVAGIIALYPLMYAPFRRMGLPDPWELSEDTLKWKARQMLASQVGGLMAMSMAAWLVSMPLTAYLFNLFSPGGLVGNLFVVPAATAIVWTGLFTLIVGTVSDTAAAFGNGVNQVIVSSLLWLIELLDRIPLSHRFVATPPLLLVVIYYAALFSLTIRQMRRRWIAIGLVAMVLGFGARLAWNVRLPSMDFLPLDRGQAELIHVPGPDILIDAGPGHRAFALRRHLESNGVNKLEALILTHADASHVGGAPDILANWPVKELWIPDTPRTSASMKQAVGAAERADVAIRRIAQGDRGNFAGGLTWECLHPPRGYAPDRADDHSLVLRISRGNSAVLLTGGMDSELERTFTEEASTSVLHLGNNMDPDVGSDAWLARTQAEVVIVPAYTYIRDGNPNRDVLQRIQSTGATVINLSETNRMRFRFERPAFFQLR